MEKFKAKLPIDKKMMGVKYGMGMKDSMEGKAYDTLNMSLKSKKKMM